MICVFDTNVIISALCFPFSKERAILDKVKSDGKIITSEDTLDELKNVLQRNKFDKYINIQDRLIFLEILKKYFREIEITKKIQICRDKNDDKFIELAVNGNVII